MDRRKKEHVMYKKLRHAAVVKRATEDKKKAYFIATQIEIADRKLKFYHELNKILNRS